MNLYDKNRDGDKWAFAKFGDKAIKMANRLARDVAKRISIMDGGEKCEYLEIASVSSTKKPVIFADFSDGVRMWFRGGEIENPHICRWDDASGGCPWRING